MAVMILSDTEDVECTSPCNSSGRGVIFLEPEIPVFNHSNSTMQKRISDFYIESGYSHFVSRTYLFILKLSVIGFLFLLSFSVIKSTGAGKNTVSLRWGFMDVLDYLYLHHPFAVYQHRYF